MATTKRERQKAARREKMERMQKSAKRRQSTRRLVIIGIVAILVLGTGTLLFAGGSSTTTTSTTAATTTTSTTTTTISSTKVATEQKRANAAAVAAGCPASTTTRVNTLTWKSAPAMTIDKTKPYYAHFRTTVGNFVVKLDAATAPVTVNNFVFLVTHKFYDCVIFHRVIPGFVVQGGDPQGSGIGGPGYTIADELPKLGAPTYPLYSLAMANTGRPHTGGSQFFIVTGVNGEALPASYSLFGQVVSGQNVVKTINDEGSTTGQPPTVTQRMVSVTIASS
jgi:cyclophilin family peptidyl-prolyl cis-trans isomerase